MQAFDFTEKVAIVTGGGGGIGRAASITLSDNGAKVVVVDLSEEAGMLTVNEIKEKAAKRSSLKPMLQMRTI